MRITVPWLRDATGGHLQPRERTQALVAADRLDAQPRRSSASSTDEPSPSHHVRASSPVSNGMTSMPGRERALRDSLLSRGEHRNRDEHEARGRIEASEVMLKLRTPAPAAWPVAAAADSLAVSVIVDDAAAAVPCRGMT